MSGDTVEASRAAVQVAALIPDEIRKNADPGEIVLTTAGALRKPDPQSVFLPEEEVALSGNGHGDDPESESYVHPALVSDRDTLSALKKLELKPPSPESIFRSLAKRVLNGGSSPEASDALHEKFWVSARKLTVEDALSVIREFKDRKGRKIWPTSLRVRTLAGNWRLLHLQVA